MSEDCGGGFGVNLFNGSIVVGISLICIDNFIMEILEDVNGDGLFDIVFVGDFIMVCFNIGIGFVMVIFWSGFI